MGRVLGEKNKQKQSNKEKSKGQRECLITVTFFAVHASG